MSAAARAREAWELSLAPSSRSHIPVLATELVDLISPQPGDTVVDCTFGAGGHAAMVAEQIGPEGTLVAIDRDPVAREHFDRFAATATCRTRFIAEEFSSAPEVPAK